MPHSLKNKKVNSGKYADVNITNSTGSEWVDEEEVPAYMKTRNPIYYGFTSAAPVHYDLKNKDDHIRDSIGVRYYFPKKDDPILCASIENSEIDYDETQKYEDPSRVMLYFKVVRNVKKEGGGPPSPGDRIDFFDPKTELIAFTGICDYVNQRKSGVTGWVCVTDFIGIGSHHRMYKTYGRNQSVKNAQVYQAIDDSDEPVVSSLNIKRTKKSSAK